MRISDWSSDVCSSDLFLFALGLMYVFGVMLRWLPISGGGSWLHYLMPSIALGYYATPAIMRLTRSGMMDVLQSDHVRTARAYGLAPWRVVIRHGLRHAIIPVVSLAAVQLGFMLGGSIVIETVFSLKGLGYLAWESIQRPDIEVIQAILLVLAEIGNAAVGKECGSTCTSRWERDH